MHETGVCVCSYVTVNFPTHLNEMCVQAYMNLRVFPPSCPQYVKRVLYTHPPKKDVCRCLRDSANFTILSIPSKSKAYYLPTRPAQYVNREGDEISDVSEFE